MARLQTRSMWFRAAIRAIGSARFRKSDSAFHGYLRGAQARQFIRGGCGAHPWAFACFKPQIHPKCLRQQQDVRKQNRRIKSITADRLQVTSAASSLL